MMKMLWFYFEDRFSETSSILNEFTIYFMGCKVRLCGLEKLSQQKNKVEYSQTLYRHAGHEKENSE